MSQAAVEQVVGRMLLDQTFREQVAADADGALNGYDLTDQERAGLKNIDLADFDQTAAGLAGRISKGLGWN